MEHTWIKFCQDWLQKAKDGKDEKKFSTDEIIQVDEEVAKSLIDLGIAEKTDEPKIDNDVAKAVKELETNISEVIEKTLSNSLKIATENIKKSVPAIAKGENYDLETETGFKDEDHFFKAVQNGARGGNNSFDGLEFLTKAPTGQNISTDVDGGFAVPDIVSDRIWTNIQEDPASLMSRTLNFTTAGTSMKIPTFFEASRKSGRGNRHAGIETTWLDEAGQIQETTGTLGKLNLELHKLGAVVYFTEEMLDDQGFDFSGFIRGQIPKAINFAVEEAIFHGTGVGKPKGFLKGDSIITVGLEDGQGNHTLLHKNVSNMYNRNWNRTQAIWLAHPDAAQQLEFMFFNDDDTNQRPVYLPSNQIVGSPFASLYGRPVIINEHSRDFGDPGDICFVDMSQYAVLLKAGQKIKSASSIHVRFLFEETAFRFTMRVDGRELWTSPKEDLYGDTTRSPFVCLASRTGGGTSSGL